MPDTAPADFPSPAPLFADAVAFWRSSTLFAALDLDCFSALADGPLTVAELASRLGVCERPLSFVADALVAMELLARDDAGRISNSATTAAYLCKGSPAYLGDTIAFNARTYNAWSGLAETVRSETPPMAPTHFLGDDPAATRNFVLAMHQRALGVARCLVGMLDLSQCRRLLDLGGGPATYAALLAARFPALEVTVVDLPGVLAVAEELIAGQPGAERIRLQAGDIFADSTPLGEGTYDALLVSGVIHRTEGAHAGRFLARAGEVLAPGALVAVADVFTGAPTTGPVLPELFSIHMLLTAEEGRALPLSDMADHFATAGMELQESRPLPPPLPHTLCTGVRR
jgi:SAM-dependent methyltransferase